MSTTTPSPIKIAIIGAGPSGLILANLLLHSPIAHQLSLTIFDLRPPPPSNIVTTPSGSLDLHTESGQLALDACGLMPKFKELETDCSEDMILADKEGKVRYKDDGGSHERPEIARNALMDLLLSNLPKGSESVRWGRKIVSASPSASASTSARKWTLRSQMYIPKSKNNLQESHEEQQNDGKEEEQFDILLSTTGAWSPLRHHLTPVAPHYTTISCITLTLPNITTSHPSLATMIGKGSFSACGDYKAVMAQRGSVDSARIYLMISSESPSYLVDSGLEDLIQSPLSLKEKLLTSPELFETWGAELKELIAAACEWHSTKTEEENEGLLEMRPLYMLPTDHTWEHTPGLTLLGDAAHLMSPFAGEGVNQAMLDALELSKTIISSLSLTEVEGKEDTRDNQLQRLDEGIVTFEKEMWTRSKVIAEETWENLKMIMRDKKAPEAFVKFFESHGPPPES